MKEIKCPGMRHFPRGKKARAEAIEAALASLYPEARCALDFEGDPFRLLVMARLSAQCTDKRVNEVSVSLFRRFPDAAAFATAEREELESLVRPCGLYRSKAKQIQEMSRLLMERFDGNVPASKEILLSLPGVGEKIANLMMGDVFGDPHIVADTHCIRLAGRMGLTKSRNPAVVTKDLEAVVPKEKQADFCHRIITLGREYCRAQSPKCEECPFQKDPRS